VGKNDSPIVLVRFVTVRGLTRFVPIGLLTLPGGTLLAKKAAIVQPLPNEVYSEPQPCIGKWTLVLPAALGGVAAAYLVPPKVMPKDRIQDWDAFEKYITKKTKPGTPGEGLVLLAHHDGAKVRFSPKDQRYVSAAEIKRRFSPGSIAVLAACSAGEIGGGERDMPFLSQLNTNGIEAAIVSPFDIHAPLGARFAMHFADQIAKAQKTKETPDLITLHRRTVAAVAKGNTVKVMAPELAEFVLAGNVGLRVCQ
jgi:hypothetical protein